MQEKSVYGFESYKKYLDVVLSPKGEGRGLRTRLAHEIGVQTAFISQVLRHDVHFSLEHSLKVSKFLDHTEGEAHYFMLMLEFARAGTNELKHYFKAQMDVIQTKRMEVTERLQVKNALTVEDQMLYYSTWHYSALHVLLSIPALQTKQALAQALKLSSAKVSEYLEFLCRTGLALEEGGHYRIGTTRIHVPSNSPMFSKHHTNWRVKAIQALEDFQPKENLHFSGAITLSKADAEKIRKVLLDAIERTEAIYRPSKEEVAYAIILDFFPI